MPFTFFTFCNVFQSTYANSTITFEIGNLSLGNIFIHVRVTQQNDIDGTLMEEINYRVELFLTIVCHCVVTLLSASVLPATCLSESFAYN